MDEPTGNRQITFTHRELAGILVREQGIKSGYWGISVKFGFTATNIEAQENTDGPKSLTPAAIIPVLEIGIQEFKEQTNLTVDAAEVRKTPKKKASTKPKAKRKSAAKKKPKS